MRLIFASVLLAVVARGTCHAQDAPARPAPLYTLPPDGTWVEYEWRGLGPDRKEHVGVLKLSSVGKKRLGEADYRWIEVEHRTGTGPDLRSIVRKLLVPETALAAGGSLHGKVTEGYARSAGSSVAKLTPNEINDFLSLGIHAPTGPLTVVNPKSELETKVGKLTTRVVAASGKAGETTTLEYTGWLSEAVPFGWAKLELREKTGENPARLLATVTVTATGKDAKSAIDETKR